MAGKRAATSTHSSSASSEARGRVPRGRRPEDRPGARLRVTQVRSTISHIARNRGTIRALGLHRIGDTVEVPDNEATRGMVRAVRFLVEVEELPEASQEKKA